MGHSLQKIGEKYENLHDTDIFVVFVLMNEVLHPHPDAFPEMARVLGVWREELPYCGPGLIDLHLADVASSEAARTEFGRLMSLAEQKVAAFGGKIPMQLLNEKKPTQDVTFTSDYPSERAMKALTRLRQLVAP